MLFDAMNCNVLDSTLAQLQMHRYIDDILALLVHLYQQVLLTVYWF